MRQEPCSVLHLKLLAVCFSRYRSARRDVSSLKGLGRDMGAALTRRKTTYIYSFFPFLHTSFCLTPKFCINYRCEMLMEIKILLKSISHMQNLRVKQRMWKSKFSALITVSLVCFRSTFRSSSISNFFWKPWSLIGRVPHIRGPTIGFLAEHFRPVKVLLGTGFTLSGPAKKNIE